jgi:outer membrane biosynthesis protein TonB
LIGLPVGDGLTTGGCAVYVSADRAGHIREAWPEGCDSASLQDPLREAVKKWRLKPAISDGLPVQVEALLGFTFHTTMDKSRALPELSDEEVRKLASNAVEPVFPPGSVQKGTEVILQISIDESGKLTGVGNTHNLDGQVFGAAYAALQKWHFSPYVKNGKPQYFHANVIFRAQ